jgi:hypothetical protein
MTEPTYREAYNYVPGDYPPGYFTNQMRDHANIEIANEDAATMNCATFTDFNSLCGIISVIENIRHDRVYPALRYIGYNRCYNAFKANEGDVFSEIEGYIRQCKISRDLDKMRAAQQQVSFFVDVRTRKYRVNKQTSVIVVKQAESSGINTSHLNLYHALHGVKVLVEYEAEYFSMRDEPVIEDALRVLRRADNSLESRRKHMMVWAELK